MARYPHRRYLCLRWEEVKMRSGMTDQEVVYATEARYEWAIKAGFLRKSILLNRLDNPFAHIHARNTIVADMRKHHEAKRTSIRRVNTLRATWRKRRAA